MAESGWSWGILVSPESNIKEYGWDGDDVSDSSNINSWMIKDTTSAQAAYTSSLGNLVFIPGDEFVSPVMDKGNNDTKLIKVLLDATASVSVQLRGDSTSFSHYSVSSPIWEDYILGGVYKTWRYIQIKIKGLSIIQIGGQDLQIDGVDIGLGD